MSFGGFIGGSSSSGGNGGGDSGCGVSRVVADSPFEAMPIATIAQSQLITSPLPQSMFNSSPLSLALKPKMEGVGDMGMIGENFDAVAMGRSSREDEYESRSGSDNLDGGGSGDDLETPLGKSSRKKKYHRHTPYQIQELEASFKENPHPDEKARLELGKRLTLESRQVKFWFQNRRTQMKTQLERHENAILKQENDKLRIENIAMKEAMRSPMCSHCGGQAILGEIHIEEHHIRIENARLKDELNRICVLANKFLGRPLGSFPGSMGPPGMVNSGLELAVGRNGFGAMNSVDTALPMGLDFGNGISSALTGMSPRPTPSMTGMDVSYDKSMLMELAFAAMNELLKLAEIGDPLWFRNFDGSAEELNLEEYARSFPPCIGMKPANFTAEATKATGTVMINSLSLVETLMDTSRWVEMFSCIVGRTSTINVISSSSSGSRNGNLQLIQAEFQVLSALVPVRQVKFLRFCKQHAEGVWAVVDVSIDAIQEGSQPREAGNCRRLPSGCIVQDLPNGYSKVIWIEHMEYDESTVHNYYHPFIRSGLGFGAQRWIATLQRQCECLAVIMSSAVPSGDNTVVSPSGRRSIAMLARRMTRNFCGGVCATFYKWETIQTGTADETKLMMRKSIGDPGEPPGVVLSATRTIWLPVTHQRLFDFLRNEQTRSQWDVLSHGGPMHQIVHIAKGQDLGNSISLFRANVAAGDANQNSMLILQDSCTDVSGSIVAYAAVDTAEMNVVMSGGDSSCVAFLPSGFAIVPDCFENSNGVTNNGMVEKEGNGGGSNGSLLTLGFQILVNNLPAAKLTMESVNTVNALISRTLQGIKTAFQCS
ncbi:homeobox-leucine zipper protein ANTHOCYANINLESS 2-like isoform X1 [Lycium ferocissimum]|uniref:homeobox-leucine zipper protein ANTHOCYANINLESS 2-like isoform X1 n=2 Tax=Lycium ferocissimum TaxID=112874 RepID=UPI002815956F|nr:homeobox-leucine zipper protein ANTHOCYANINLESS 2-like isoform X1 [Lycium ferocissimum]